MTLADAIVIHFAFGSPFGVYQFTRGSVRSARSAATIAAHFVLWPIFAAAFVRKWVFENFRGKEVQLEDNIAAIRTKIETACFANRPTSSIFEFREVFCRYTALSIALKRINPAESPKYLFDIGKHKNIKLASACMARRNRHRIEFHQSAARKELIGSILAISQRRRNEIVNLAMQLARLLEDEKAAEELSKAPAPFRASNN
jgi:hypothetical protein